MIKKKLVQLLRRIFLPWKKWRWLVPFAVMGLFVWVWLFWASPESGERIGDYVPEEYLLNFQLDHTGDGFNILEDGDPGDYRVPGSIEYCTPDRLREVLGARRVMPIDPPKDFGEDHRYALRITFTRAKGHHLTDEGKDYLLVFWNDGIIFVNEYCFRDDGSCYQALRRHFGSEEDFSRWARDKK